MPRSQWPLELLDDWTIDEVLDFGVATGLTSVRRLFGRVARRYSRCLGAVLRALAATPGEPRLALLLALLPALLLHRSRDNEAQMRGTSDRLKAEVEQKMADFPDVMPYFWQQEADYRALKERCAAMAISGKAGAPEGVATIEIAVEALKIAEYLTPTLQKELL